MQSSEEKS